MFRYDNGLFVGICGLAVLAAMHAREFRVLIGRTALLVGACVACVVPFAVFLQLNGGLMEAVRQISTYARREGARTQIGTLPEGALSELRVTPMPPPPPDRVQVRWTPAADGERTALEAGYTLHDGIQRGDPQDRTWLYEIDNATPANLRTIVNDPRVADTHLIDRTGFTLNPKESLPRRLWRQSAVRWQPSDLMELRRRGGGHVLPVSRRVAWRGGGGDARTRRTCGARQAVERRGHDAPRRSVHPACAGRCPDWRCHRTAGGAGGVGLASICPLAPRAGRAGGRCDRHAGDCQRMAGQRVQD